MKNLFYFAAIAAMAMGITSCSSEDENVASNQVAKLGINVTMNDAQSRAATQVTGTAFTSDVAIGVSLFKEKTNSETDYADYATSGVVNQQYAYTNSSSSWSGNIMLNTAYGHVSAYYPYGAGINPKAIAMSTTTNPTDWMYYAIDPSKKYNAGSPSANITLKHAQAVIKVLIKKNSTNEYSGTGSISAITISSSAFTTSATLNSTTGAITKVGDVQAITESSWGKIVAAKDANVATSMTDQWFVSPIADTENATLTFMVTIDGQVYKVENIAVQDNSAAAPIKQGNVYTFTLNLSDTGLSLGTVSITAWANGGSATGTLTPSN